MTEFQKYSYDVNIKKELLKKGIPTIIPFRQFPRLSEKLPGIIHGEQVLLTANSGSGKSRFFKAWMKDVVNFGKEKGLKIKIFLNSLEESPAKIRTSVIASEVYKKYGVELSYFDINLHKIELTQQDIRNQQMIDSIQDKVNDFYKNFEVTMIPNPYGFYLHVLEYLFENGTFYFQNKPISSWNTVKAGSQHWDNYIPNDVSQFVIAASDTVDSYMEESGKTQYETIKQFSKFFTRKMLGLRCGVASVFIQQQDPDLSRAQVNFKGQLMIEQVKPGLDKLRVFRGSAEDATIAFGLFDPTYFGEHEYLGYSMDNFKDGNFRSICILKTREGKNLRGSEIPLMCYFGRDEFVELPKPDSPQLKNFYK
ncbi:MAG TPA: hypothetical protein PLG47_04265 [Candidatus Dojkabacteria bacterium]|nr:hypothetical protein [Candidatus Dojkabacteria bacterium]